MSYAGIPVVVTEHATEPRYPKEPRTDDMRAMVDEFWRRGLIVVPRVPCAYQMAGKFFIHPEIYRAMTRRLDKIVDRAFYGWAT